MHDVMVCLLVSQSSQSAALARWMMDSFVLLLCSFPSKFAQGLR